MTYLYYFYLKNRERMFSMNNNKYPENEEEKHNMKKPFAADKCPKKLIFT